MRSWQTREGLPQNSVHALAQSEEGYLWVGTRGGLARFDGVRFQTYGLTAGLKSLHISDLAVGRDGGIWIATIGGGLSRWHEGKITTLTTADGLLHNDVMALAPAVDGGVWVGSKAGLQHYGRAGFTRVGEDVGLNSEVIALAVTPRGGLWATMEETGLFYCDDGRCQRVEGPPGFRLHGYCLLVDGNGDLWISIGNGTVLRRRSEEWKAYTTADGLPFNFIYCLAEGAGGEIWAGSQEAGLYLFQDDKFRLVPGTDNAVRVVRTGRDGVIWVGTQTGGLSRLNLRRITEYVIGEGKHRGQVNGLLEDSEGKFWVGTYGGGLYRGAWNELARVTGVDKLGGRPFHTAALKMSDGTLVFGGPTLLLQHFPEDGGHKLNVISGNLTALCEGADGTLIFGTREGGLFRMPRGSDQPIQIEKFPAPISGLLRAEGNALWIATQGAGLYRRETAQMRRWTVTDGLPTNVLRALHCDAQGTLWIGTTGGGLAWFAGGRFRSIDSRDGMGDDVISQILEDRENNLWLGCNRGIFRVSKAELKAVASATAQAVHPLVLGESDGMLVTECTGGYAPAGLRGSSGLLYFSTVSGVAVVDPTRFATTPAPPPTRIEELRHDGRVFAFSSEPALLGPGVRGLEVHFTAFNNLNPEQIRFRYRIDASKENWTEVNQKRFVNFPHLAPGDYRFQVSAANQDGHWGPPAVTPAFTVLPFFWETGWFRAAIVLTVMGCGAGLVLAGARSKIRQAVAREQVVKAEAKARQHLHELTHLGRVSLVGEMATSLAHELNQPLAAIVTNAAAGERFLAKGKLDPEELREILQDIGADGRRAGEVIRGIKGMVRRVESERQPIDMNQVVNAVMRLVRADALAHGCTLDLKLDDKAPMILGDFVQLQQVLLNLVINAFDAMRAMPDIPCRLEIASRSANGGSVEISVRDFGPGLPPDSPEKVFERFFSTKQDGMGMGLAIARSIIEAHSGSIGAENVPDGGARFWFQLPAHSPQPREVFA